MSDQREQTIACPNILVVEDDPDQRELIVEVLQMHFGDSAGRRIRGVGSAAQCLAIDLGTVDVVLLDYNLPDSTGLDLLDEIVKLTDVPVIFVTGEKVTDTAIQAIQRGAMDYIVKLGDYLFAVPVQVEKNLRQYAIRKDKQRLQAQLEATIEEVRIKNIQLKESLLKLEQMAATDPVTNLANRRHFSQMIEKYFNEAVRYDFDLTCVMIDLDDYKVLNDTLGHQMGDSILLTTAQVIQANLRSSDVAARYGGDEFVLLLPHTSTNLAATVAGRIASQLAQASAQYVRTGQPLTISAGIASIRLNKPADSERLLAMADMALYTSKDAGKNRITIYGADSILSHRA